MPFKCDVAIVGGGPAGSAAANWCARNGLDTILIEAQPFPRDRPGESLHPGVEALFRQLGVEEAAGRAEFPRFRGHWVMWGGPPRLDLFGEDSAGPWLGFQAWRARLDGLLLEGAKAAGARILQPCRAVAPLIANSRVAGVACKGDEIHARFTIDAGGGRHWLQRASGSEMRYASRRLIATYGYCRGTSDQFGDEPLLTGDRNGWTWTARVNPQLYAWTRLGFRRVERQPPATLRSLQPASPVRGADVTWRIVDGCAGAGYFICGDAASVVDPAASHGVLKALMSGILAADLIVRMLQNSISEAAAAEAFRHWTAAWFRRDTAQLARLYRSVSAVT
jgi:flavin-dependent dehydrogenase